MPHRRFRFLPAPAGIIRELQATDLPLFRDHLLRLDPSSRRDRFNGSTDEAPFEVVGGVVKIKTANIGDLNANNITAGTLNVDRINAGTIVTTKLATNAVTEG